MSERTTDPRPNGQSPIVTGFMVAAAVAAAAGPIIALIEGGHYLLTIGVCLIISGIVFLAALTLKRLRRRLKKTPPRVQQIALGVVGIVFVASGIVFVLMQHPSRAATCHMRASVSGASSSALQLKLIVHLSCLAPPGNQLYLMEQRLDEGRAGTEKHSEYVFGWKLQNATGSQSFIDTPPGCVSRRYYVISVTSDQLDLLQSSPHTSSEAYFQDPIDSYIGKYIWSNVQTNHSCNKQS